jgi:hypothetical protein
MAITTETNIENYLLTDINNSFSANITDWILGVQEEIDNLTCRQIIADTSETTLTYSGDGKDVLFIDDFILISEVKVDGVLTTDFYKHPVNISNQNPTPAVWKLIHSTDVWTEGVQNITVKGKRGFVAEANLPKDLVWAATVLASQIVLTSKNSGKTQQIKAEFIGAYKIEFYEDKEIHDVKRAYDIISKYRKYTKYAIV